MVNELVSINNARPLTSEQYAGLSNVPPEIEWLGNIANPKTGRAGKIDAAEFPSA